MFEGTSLNYLRVVAKSSELVVDWLISKTHQNSWSSLAAEASLDVSSQSSASLVFYCNGAFCSSSCSAAIGGVLKDPSGCIVDGFAKKVQSSSPLCSEALAVREACLIIHRRELRDCIIVGDK